MINSGLYTIGEKIAFDSRMYFFELERALSIRTPKLDLMPIYLSRGIPDNPPPFPYPPSVRLDR